jgi:hypothetical protein
MSGTRQYKAVYPLAPIKFTLAPFSNRSLTIFRSPLFAAIYSKCGLLDINLSKSSLLVIK